MPPLATLDFLQLGSPRHGGTFGFGFSISALKSNEGGYDLVRYIQWQESRIVHRSGFYIKTASPIQRFDTKSSHLLGPSKVSGNVPLRSELITGHTTGWFHFEHGNRSKKFNNHVLLRNGRTSNVRISSCWNWIQLDPAPDIFVGHPR